MQPQIIPRSEHCISRKNIDPDALKVLYRLYRSGHTAFLVGGGVRDLLIGRKPKDFDVSTSARPGQVKKLFRNCWLIGRRFRLAHIHFRDHKIIEVSTFRSEPAREEGESDDDLLVRRDNTFGTPEEDALRRDFTINGLFYDIASFSLIDYVGGVDDIESGVIRTIGDPRIRFQEDPVRMIRAVKFAARLDFAVEPETWDALCELVEDIRKSSTSRVMEEVARLLEGGASCRSLQLVKAAGMLPIVLPEVYEYLHGLPAGPGMQREGRREAEAADVVEAVADAGFEDEIPGEREHEDDLGPADVDDAVLAPVFGDEEEGEPVADELELAEDEGLEEAVEASELDEPVAEEAEGLESVDEEVDEDEALVLLEDEDESLQAFIPGGLRCVKTSDRGGRLWRMLGAVDLLQRSGRALTRPAIFAALLMPIVNDTADWMAQRMGEGEDPIGLFPRVLRPLTSSVLISRRDRERVCQLMVAQRKFLQNSPASVAAFARKPYFAEALDLFEITVLATGENMQALDWWRRHFPPMPGGAVARVEVEEPRHGGQGGGRTRRRGRSPEPVREREVPMDEPMEGMEEMEPDGESGRPRRRRRRRRRSGGADR